MNLSKQKRERLLNFIKELKSSDSFDEKSLIELNEIENELNGKKYGLVWEEHEEDVDVQMRNNIPVFTEVKDKEVQLVDGGGYNFLLEGDNLHSLYLLEKTHKGKIDVIYIDPPYNTGRNDFVYNDDKIGEDDGFRHSKWISFMEKRLRMASKLMSEKGVIFISIDDREQANLKLLCDEVFSSTNFICEFIWTNNEGGGGSDSKFIKTKHEYVLCYSKDINNFHTKNVPIEDEERYRLEDEYVNERGKYQLVKLSSASIQYSTSLDYEIKMPDGTIVHPVDNTDKNRACWRWSKKKLQWGLDNGFIVYKKDKKQQWQVYTKQYVNCDKDGNIVKRTKTPLALIDKFSSTQASNKLIELFGDKRFNYPKPVDLIKWLIDRNVVCNCILDFFAGSGTTAQAVLELNKEDGGNRKFILCTNNENQICEEVTMPRIKTVITGKRADGSKYSEGLTANLKYFKTDFVSKNSKNLSKELTKHVKELIELEWGVNIDKKVNLMVMTEEELDKIEANWDKLKTTVKSIYRARQVVYTGKQKELFKNINNYIIPDYYFDDELKEVGENW